MLTHDDITTSDEEGGFGDYNGSQYDDDDDFSLKGEDNYGGKDTATGMQYPYGGLITQIEILDYDSDLESMTDVGDGVTTPTTSVMTDLLGQMSIDGFR